MIRQTFKSALLLFRHPLERVIDQPPGFRLDVASRRPAGVHLNSGVSPRTSNLPLIGEDAALACGVRPGYRPQHFSTSSMVR